MIKIINQSVVYYFYSERRKMKMGLLLMFSLLFHLKKENIHMLFITSEVKEL